MKIKSIDTKDTFRLVLRHPATQQELAVKSGAPMYIDVYGAHTEQYKRITRQWQNEALRNRKAKMTAEQLESRSTELLAACTVGWNLEDENDKPVPFSVATARELYASKDSPWIRPQVDEAIHEAANFVGESLAA